jgi:hypothetical protein
MREYEDRLQAMQQTAKACGSSACAAALTGTKLSTALCMHATMDPGSH